MEKVKKSQMPKDEKNAVKTLKALEKKNDLPPKNDEKQLGSLSISATENGTREIEMWKQENKISVDKLESPIESYEAQSNFFQRELLQSTSVLNESVEQLHSQTKLMLKQPESEARRVDIYNIEQARLNMNTMAKLIQTKVNFIKALKG